MGRQMHWIGNDYAIDQSTDSVNFDFWTDENGTPITVSAGLPTNGDSVYWDGSAQYPDIKTAHLTGNLDWSGVRIAGGTVVVAGYYSLSLSTTSTIAAGCGIVCPDNSLTLSTAAQWEDSAVNLQGFAFVTLASGWKVKGGQAGASILLGTDHSIPGGITIESPGGGQSAIFNNINIVGNGANVDISGLSGIKILGTFNRGDNSGGCYYTYQGPTGTVTLGAKTATAAGVGNNLIAIDVPADPKVGGGMVVV